MIATANSRSDTTADHQTRSDQRAIRHGCGCLGACTRFALYLPPHRLQSRKGVAGDAVERFDKLDRTREVDGEHRSDHRYRVMIKSDIGNQPCQLGTLVWASAGGGVGGQLRDQNSGLLDQIGRLAIDGQVRIMRGLQCGQSVHAAVDLL
jgi:hypothetical protein